MIKKGEYQVLSLCLIIILLCLSVVTIGSSDIVSYQTESRVQHSLPPLPPGYEGDATPNADLKSDYIVSDNLRLEDNEIQLYTGWNMISTPLCLQSGYDTASVVFSGVNTSGHSIWTYDGEQQDWVAMGANTIVTPLVGIWIYSNQSTVISLDYDSSQTVMPVSLYSGSNLIGFPSIDSATARDTLYCVHEDWTEVVGYDAVNQQYETSIYNGGTGIYSDEREMYPTKGYWVEMNDNGTLIVLGTPWADDYDFYYTTEPIAITIPFAQTAADLQSTMSYGGMPHSNSTSLYAYNRMPYDAVFLFLGHGVESSYGNKGGAVFFWNGTDNSTIAAEQTAYTPYYPTYFLSSYNTEINDILLAVYAACWSGRSSPDYGDLLDMSTTKGVDNVIGFEDPLTDVLVCYWSDRFWYRCREGGFLGSPQKIYDVAQSSKTDVLIAYHSYGGVDSLCGN